ncbi:alpha amylase C-terminal domain-containing protein [bacterium]|nr:alpha amylase C-terminal domain-containing protein [bacterium]
MEIKSINYNSKLNIKKNSTDKIDNKELRTENRELASKEAATSIKAYSITNNQISFGKKIEEHRSWGANVQNTNTDGSQQVSFKIWAPKASKVLVEVRNPEDKVSLTEEEFKAEHLKDKWAGDWHIDADSDDGKSVFIELEKSSNGVYQGTSDIPFSNGMYRYILQDNNGQTISKTKDPVAKAQPHIFSWSQIYDNNQYEWTDGDWVAGKNSARVSDLARQPQDLLRKSGLSATGSDGKSLMKPSSLIVRQVNIPTLTQEGSLESAKAEIDKIAKDGIYNGILLMPVEGTYGENWGYDGVDKYAVSRGVASDAGKEDATQRNDALKDLINYAHSKNINVGMDWVPSHIFKAGPCDADAKQFGISNGEKLSGNNLSDVAPYEKPGKWGGSQFNLEDSNSSVRSNVRDYVVNMPMNWVDNYHIDFLRADQTPEMGSNYAMKQVAQEIRYHFPHTVLHWEDHRTQDGLTRDLTTQELPYNNLDKHLEAINKTEANNVSLENIGGNEHWDFAFSHAVEAVMLNKEVMGYYPSMQTLANNIKDIGGTKYFMSHDEIGNDSGSRLMTKIIHKDLQVTNHLDDRAGETPAEKHIRSVDTVMEMFKAYEFDKENWNKNFEKIAKEKGLKGISKEQMEAEIEHAKNKHKQAIGLLFMVPGSKMMFQGDAYGEINPFRFTREQAVDEPNIEKEKGYNFDKSFEQSKIDPEHHTIEGIFKISQAMSDLVKRNPALQDVQSMEHLDAMTPLIDEQNKVIVIKRFDLNGNEVVGLYNFGDKPLANYGIQNPICVLNDGTWVETINSNAETFDGTGEYTNTGRYSAKNNDVKMNIPANGFVILEKINQDGTLQKGQPKFN